MNPYLKGGKYGGNFGKVVFYMKHRKRKIDSKHSNGQWKNRMTQIFLSTEHKERRHTQPGSRSINKKINKRWTKQAWHIQQNRSNKTFVCCHYFSIRTFAPLSVVYTRERGVSFTMRQV